MPLWSSVGGAIERCISDRSPPFQTFIRIIDMGWNPSNRDWNALLQLCVQHLNAALLSELATRMTALQQWTPTLVDDLFQRMLAKEVVEEEAAAAAAQYVPVARALISAAAKVGALTNWHATVPGFLCIIMQRSFLFDVGDERPSQAQWDGWMELAPLFGGCGLTDDVWVPVQAKWKDSFERLIKRVELLPPPTLTSNSKLLHRSATDTVRRLCAVYDFGAARQEAWKRDIQHCWEDKLSQLLGHHDARIDGAPAWQELEQLAWHVADWDGARKLSVGSITWFFIFHMCFPCDSDNEIALQNRKLSCNRLKRWMTWASRHTAAAPSAAAAGAAVAGGAGGVRVRDTAIVEQARTAACNVCSGRDDDMAVLLCSLDDILDMPFPAPE